MLRKTKFWLPGADFQWSCCISMCAKGSVAISVAGESTLARKCLGEEKNNRQFN